MTGTGASFGAWEAVTSLGESAAETALLLRAGLCNVAPSRFIDAKGQRVMFCSAPAIAPDLVGIDRASALAHFALTRLGERIGAADRGVLLLAVADHYGAGENTFARSKSGAAFLERLRSAMSFVRRVEIELFPFGRAAGAVALQRALELVGDDALVIWGGVDTMYDWPVLESLERRERLLTADNIDGVRPGEAAAVVTLQRSPDAVHILGVGVGREPHPLGSAEPCRSDGLTMALRRAVGPLRSARRRSNCWLLDTSHEEYATHELQNIIARFGDVLGTGAELQMPLKELGDVGAAAMPLLAVLAGEAWRLGYANDDTAVITGCSADGARGALALAAPAGFRPEERAA